MDADLVPLDDVSELHKFSDWVSIFLQTIQVPVYVNDPEFGLCVCRYPRTRGPFY